MNTTRKFQLELRVWEPGPHSPMAYNCEIDPLFHEEMKPVHEVDDPVMAFVEMGRASLHSVAEMNREQRKKLAERFAKDIAENLVEALATRDTMNGYPV